MSTRIIRTLCVLAVALAALVAVASVARADEGPAADTATAVQCPGPDEVSLATAACDPVALPDGVDPADTDPADTPEVLAAAAAKSRAASELPRQCRYHSEAVFYGERDWIRLAKKLSENTSYCADFFISVPPVVADKTKPRPGEADRIKAFGDVFHPMNDVQWGAWSNHVTGSLLPRYASFYLAGVEAGHRTIAAGYDLWALNEVPAIVRQGDPTARANMAQFIAGLHDGSGVQGLVFVSGVGQRTSPLDVYHDNLQNWLYDGLFWSSIADDVRFWAQEVYGDVRAWAVRGASRNERTRHLADYLMHGANLAETLGDAAEPARQLMERTYVPLANLAWRRPTAYGYTDVPLPLIESYVAEQVFALRHYTGSHPHLAPGGRFGAAYSPFPFNPIDEAGQDTLLTRLASSLHEAYEEGGGSQMGACGEPGEHVWCLGELDGAAFVEGWDAFGAPRD